MFISNVLTLVFTGVIAVATVAYTVVSHRLWKATERSTDIARFNAFLAYMSVLATQIEKSKPSDPATASLLEGFMGIVGELAVGRLLEDVNVEKDEDAREYFEKIFVLFRAHGIDPSAVPGFAGLAKRLGSPPAP